MKTHPRITVLFLVILSATTLSARADSVGLPNWNALRGADTKRVSRVLERDINGRDSDGNSALHVAALHGSAAMVRLLLERGADANATNSFGAVPLIYAAGDYEKVRLLLAHGANPNRASAAGNSPLIAASGHPDSSRTVALLLGAGARIAATNVSGLDAIGRAAFAGNTEVVKLLLRAGANPNTRPMQPGLQGGMEPGSMPLHSAAFRGEGKMIQALLDAGAELNAVEPFAGNALHNAVYANHPQAAAVLIRRGINLNLRSAIGDVPTMVWAGYSDVGDASVARLLFAKHVDPGVENEAGENVLTWARKRGDNPLVRFLTDRGVVDRKQRKETKIPHNEVPDQRTDHWVGAIRQGIQRSVDLLQTSSSVFLDSKLAQQNNCVSCHQQTFPATALAAARASGFKINEPLMRKQYDAQIKSWTGRVPNAYEMEEPQPDAPVNLGIGLLGLFASNHKADALTEAMVWYLVNLQERDGSWRSDDFRPPLEDGRIPAAALVIRALQCYPIEGREAECRQRIERAANWLARVEARTPNRLAFQLRGLKWSGSHAEDQRRIAKKIISAQREDGGWGQLPGLESDAWATGQALVALHEAGALQSTDTLYQRGVEFLLRTQFADGSWLVRSRTWPFQPYFNSQFPHGKDQWISAAGTTWATLALLNCLESTPPSVRQVVSSGTLVD